VYAFGGGDPINGSDPSGLQYQCRTYWFEVTEHFYGGAMRHTANQPHLVLCNDPSPGQEPLDLRSLFGGGPGRGDPGKTVGRQSYAIPYTAARCPAFFRSGPVRNALRQAWRRSAANGGNEAGGYVTRSQGGPFSTQWYTGQATPVSMPGWPASKPVGAVFWFHTHYPFAGDSLYPQGPSVGDLSITQSDGIPGFVASADSLFWFNPDGTAYGCSR
jgi:hypothetical protein